MKKQVQIQHSFLQASHFAKRLNHGFLRVGLLCFCLLWMPGCSQFNYRLSIPILASHNTNNQYFKPGVRRPPKYNTYYLNEVAVQNALDAERAKPRHAGDKKMPKTTQARKNSTIMVTDPNHPESPQDHGSTDLTPTEVRRDFIGGLESDENDPFAGLEAHAQMPEATKELSPEALASPLNKRRPGHSQKALKPVSHTESAPSQKDAKMKPAPSSIPASTPPKPPAAVILTPSQPAKEGMKEVPDHSTKEKKEVVAPHAAAPKHPAPPMSEVPLPSLGNDTAVDPDLSILDEGLVGIE